MNSTLLIAAFSPLAIMTVVAVAFSYYHSGMKKVSEYEKELKELRNHVLRGDIGHKTFVYIKDNLKAEDIFKDESKRLDNMLKQNLIDQLTYDRMKKLLQITFNEKLMKIHTSHTLENNVVQ